MNVFDTAKSEIKEMIDLAKDIERFDYEIMFTGWVKPTKTAINRRNKLEKRYIRLLKKYT